MSEREQALRKEIEQLEAQIRDLAGQAGQEVPSQPQGISPQPMEPAFPATGPRPRLRSTALPGGRVATKPSTAAGPATPSEQVFEAVDHSRLQTTPEAADKALYNQLGVRKYDLPGAWQRLKGMFRGTSSENQTLVKLLAAGNIQGLRPLRYEKRVARRRFVFFVIALFLVLWGIIALFLRH